MAATVTSDFTVLWDAESTTNWTLNKGDTYSGFQRQGSYCLGDQVSQTSYTDVYSLSSAVNLDGKYIYFWVQLWGNPDTLANGGIRFRLSDGTNTIEVHVGGSDKRGMRYGGWEAFCFYCNKTYIQDNMTYTTVGGSLGSLDLTNITEVGVGWKMLSKVVGTSPNVLWDVCYYGTKLTVTGGSDTDPATWKDIADADASTSNAWGVISEVESGVFEIQGKLVFGDSSGTGSVYFKDTSKLLVFKDMWVDAYSIDVVGNSSGTTYFYWGEKSGTAGINGLTIRCPSGIPLNFDAYTHSSNITDFGIYGSTIIDGGTIKLPDSSSAEVLNTSFISCDIVYAYQCTIQGCNFITANDRALWLPTNNNVSDCSFIGNNHATYLTTAGTYTYDALQFSNNTYDIENASSGDVTVNAVNGSNPSTYDNSGGGTTTIVNSVYLTVYVKDEDNNPVQDAAVYIEKASDGTELMNQLSDSNGKAQTTYNYTGDTDIIVRVRKSSPGATRYFPLKTTGTITSNGFTVTTVLIKDDIASP